MSISLDYHLKKKIIIGYIVLKTNIKLIPLFISELANTFISKGDYLLHLDKVCADQGTISDDGDNWVDKHSGVYY